MKKGLYVIGRAISGLIISLTLTIAGSTFLQILIEREEKIIASICMIGFTFLIIREMIYSLIPLADYIIELGESNGN